MQLWLFLALFSVAQDSGLKSAIDSGDESAARGAISSLVEADTAAAVAALADGYEHCLKRIEQIKKDERTPLIEREKAYGDVWQEWAKWEKIVESGGRVSPAEKEKFEKWKVDKEDYKKLKKEIGDVDRKITRVHKLKGSIIDALARFKSAESVGRLRELMSGSGSWELKAGLAEAMGTLEHDQAIAALRERLGKSKSPAELVAILRGLQRRGVWDPETVQAVAGLLGSDYWQVVQAAAAALATTRSPLAIEPLLAALRRADGRSAHEISGALARLTGQHFGGDSKAWKKWWKENRDGVLSQDELPKRAGSGSDQGTQVRFYGIPVNSQNVIFIIDRSGSMAEPGAYNEEASRWIATGGDKRRSSRLRNLKPEGERKIDIARYQLKKVLYMLPRGTFFNIIFYNQVNSVMSEKMVKLDDKTRKEAFGFIDPLNPVGATDIWGALHKAMEFCAERGPDGRLSKKGADTIFLLTDGLPFPPGEAVGPADIRARMKEWNRNRGIVVHTIFVAAEGTKDWAQGNEFMKELAGENHGMFKGPKNTIWKKEIGK